MLPSPPQYGTARSSLGPLRAIAYFSGTLRDSGQPVDPLRGSAEQHCLCSWPNTLQMVTTLGTALVSRRSNQAAETLFAPKQQLAEPIGLGPRALGRATRAETARSADPK